MSKKKKKNEKPQIIVCPHCGEQYHSDNKYCPYCHKDAYGHSDGYTPMSDKKATTIKIVLSVILLAVFVVLYFFVLNR